MRKIKIIQATRIRGDHCDAGKVYEVEENDAAFLIAIGKAVDFKEPEEKPAPKRGRPKQNEPEKD